MKASILPSSVFSKRSGFISGNDETSLMNEKESERILHAIEEISSSGERTIANAEMMVIETSD